MEWELLSANILLIVWVCLFVYSYQLVFQNECNCLVVCCSIIWLSTSTLMRYQDSSLRFKNLFVVFLRHNLQPPRAPNQRQNRSSSICATYATFQASVVATGKKGSGISCELTRIVELSVSDPLWELNCLLFDPIPPILLARHISVRENSLTVSSPQQQT